MRLLGSALTPTVWLEASPGTRRLCECWPSARRCPSTALQVASECGRANAAPLAAESLQADIVGEGRGRSLRTRLRRRPGRAMKRTQPTPGLARAGLGKELRARAGGESVGLAAVAAGRTRMLWSRCRSIRRMLSSSSPRALRRGPVQSEGRRQLTHRCRRFRTPASESSSTDSHRPQLRGHAHGSGDEETRDARKHCAIWAAAS